MRARRRRLIGDLSDALAAGFAAGRARLPLRPADRQRRAEKNLEATYVKGWRRGRRAEAVLVQEELPIARAPSRVSSGA